MGNEDLEKEFAQIKQQIYNSLKSVHQITNKQL